MYRQSYYHLILHNYLNVAQTSAVIRGAFICRVLGLILMFSCPSFAAAQELYVVYGARGVKTFTSRKPKSGTNYRVVRARQSSRSVVIRRRGWNPVAVRSKYDNIITSTANLHRVEPALVKSVIHAESAFNSSALSPKGAVGLMQLMPFTAKHYGVSDRYRPEQNIAGGVRYLRKLIDRYNGNLHLVLAAYNAGEKSVERYRGVPPYRETKTYIKRVLSLLDKYRLADANNNS